MDHPTPATPNEAAKRFTAPRLVPQAVMDAGMCASHPLVKYQPISTRRNIRGFADYVMRFEYANGAPVLFDTRAEAVECAAGYCADPAHGLYAPDAEEVTK